MKKIFTLLLLLVASIGLSQNSGITYQAVIYGPNGQQLPGANNQQYILANKTICLRFSIIDQTGTVEYQETIVTTTDKFGMVNLLIGTGNQVSGYAPNFAGIVWNANTKSLKVELDPSQNCQNFTQISNNPFTYVPFAYFSANPGLPGPTGPAGPVGPAGPQGVQGIAGATGPQGIPGSNGLNGAPGAQGPQGIQGVQGAAGMPGTNGLNGSPGLNGINGISAYQVAVNNGFVGTEQQWLLSLIGASGTNGLSAYQVAVNNGFVGTEQQWLISLIGASGTNGLSAYQVAVNNGFVGNEQQWLASLQGAQGIQGPAGPIGNSNSSGYFLSVNELSIPLVLGSCETNGGPLQNIIASSGSWWTLPTAVGWFSCYTSPNGLWWGGCNSGPLSTIQPNLCQLQITSPVSSQVIHNYLNFFSKKVQYNIKKIGQCFDTDIIFKFYDTNNNLIPSFVEYKRGITNGSPSSAGGITNLPITTSYLSSNNTQTYTLLMSEFSQAFYENSLTFFLPQNAVRMEIIFNGLAANNFSQSCLQSLYTTRTPAGYGSGAGTNNGRYYLGSVDYALIKWQ